MKPSLSMIVPVRDRETTISTIFSQLVETLPDLTPRWELFLVDDGSTDATPEVLAELARPYPQVGLIHHSAPRGDSASFRAGVRRARGDLVLLRAEDCNVDTLAIDAVWKAAAQNDLVLARAAEVAPSVPRRGLIARRPMRVVQPGAALQLIRRRAIREWAVADEEQDLQVFLDRRHLVPYTIELRRAASLAVANMADRRQIQPRHCDAAQLAGAPKRPNYLLRLKEFALGE